MQQSLAFRRNVLMSKSSIRPEDILPDGVDRALSNGVSVRKGTVAAFLANIEMLEQANNNIAQRQEALMMLKELAPGVVAVGLHRHVVFKNAEVEQILIDL